MTRFTPSHTCTWLASLHPTHAHDSLHSIPHTHITRFTPSHTPTRLASLHPTHTHDSLQSIPHTHMTRFNPTHTRTTHMTRFNPSHTHTWLASLHPTHAPRTWLASLHPTHAHDSLHSIPHTHMTRFAPSHTRTWLASLHPTHAHESFHSIPHTRMTATVFPDQLRSISCCRNSARIRIFFKKHVRIGSILLHCLCNSKRKGAACNWGETYQTVHYRYNRKENKRRNLRTYLSNHTVYVVV